MCRLYGVTRSGYYGWRSRGQSKRDKEDSKIFKAIEKIYKASRGTYGSPRIFDALMKKGFRISRKRVERLMRQGGLKGRCAQVYRTKKRGNQYCKIDIPNTCITVTPTKPDQVWVGDITYLKAGGRFHYCAVVMDKYSRRIIGWSLSRYKDLSLTMSALNHAIRNRPQAKGVIFHTDRGSEYGAQGIQQRLAEAGFIQSMNRPGGKLTDNAHMESFFHSMKAETIHGRTFADAKSVAQNVYHYIPFYNSKRLHSALNYMTPLEYEKLAV
jgi:transposase InsO family protein